MSDSDDDLPHLTSETFAALQEFYKEQELRELKLKNISESNPDNRITFDENWQLSQFWYDDETVDKLTKMAVKAVGSGGKIALISCPTLYSKLKESNCEVTLFEFDERFAVYGSDYVPYDYKSPLDIPRELNSKYDLVIADPPFLSEECLTKTAVTIRFLCKEKIVVCSGVVMADLVERLLFLKKCDFQPHHKNNLANEFSCYSNFDVDSLI